MVKTRLAKSARAWVDGIAEAQAVLNGCWTMKNWRSCRRKKWWAVSAPPHAVLAWPRRKKKEIQARLLITLLACSASLLGRVEVLKNGDWDGTDPCQWWVLLGIGDEFLAQPKVELS